MAPIFTTDLIREASGLGLKPGEWPLGLLIDNAVCHRGEPIYRSYNLDLLYYKYHANADPSKVFRVVAD
jgi:hypothetical protein